MAHPSLMSRFTVKCQFKALLCRICSHNPTRRCIVTSCSFQKQKGSSRQWLNRQLTDPFVIKAKQDNWRCRSAYKLLEIDDKCHLLKPGYIVIDCGAAPGSWTQVAVSKCSWTGRHYLLLQKVPPLTYGSTAFGGILSNCLLKHTAF